MKSKGIRIHDTAPWSGGKILDVTPADILDCIDYGDKLQWAIIELEGTGDLGEEKWKQLEQYKTSEQGTRISWEDLYKTCKEFSQIIWITIIGCKNEKKLRVYKDDSEMYESCEVVIELIDSSYCEVFSHDHALIDRLEKRFKDTERLSPNEAEN